LLRYKIVQRAGLKANFAAGHSFGELTALWAAGVYDDETFLNLAKTRGTAMAMDNPNEDAGGMLAVKASHEQVQQAIANLQGVKIANINSNEQVVLGGGTAAIQNAEIELKAKGFKAVTLPVSTAFHTEFVQHSQVPFASFVHHQKFHKPQIPVYANSTGTIYPDNLNELKTILKGQILNPVYFKNQIENIHAAGGRVFIEFGPKGVLTNLVKNILKGKEYTAVAMNANGKKDSDLQFRQAVAQLQVLGVQLNNVDPYKKDLVAIPAKSKMNVEISGNNYVSPPTKKAYVDVMDNGFQVSGGQTKIVEKVIEKIVEVEKVVEVPAATNQFINQIESNTIMNKEKEVRDLQKSRFGPDGSLFKMRQDLVRPIQDRVYKAIEEYATERNYDFIFDKSSASGMIFSNEKFDKTADILKKLQ
jgi:malonyl CoA-acyl carrier protein transacylase